MVSMAHSRKEHLPPLLPSSAMTRTDREVRGKLRTPLADGAAVALGDASGLRQAAGAPEGLTLKIRPAGGRGC